MENETLFNAAKNCLDEAYSKFYAKDYDTALIHLVHAYENIRTLICKVQYLRRSSTQADQLPEENSD